MNVTHLPGGTLSREITATRERIVAVQREMVTERLADPAGTLGAGRGEGLSMRGEAARLDRIRETNGLSAAFVEAAAAQLAAMGHTSGRLAQTLVGAVSGGLDRDFTRASLLVARDEIAASLNATFGGAYLFAGVTSQTEPVADPAAASAAWEARFAARFGHGSDDPAAGNIAPADAAAFASQSVAWLSGSGWSLVSNASDRPVKARIAPGETLEMSVSANEGAAREAYAAAFVSERLFASGLEGDALRAVAETTLGTAAAAGAGLARLEGHLGLAAERIERASDRLSLAADHLRGVAAERERVDPFEAAQRFQANVTQLETAYALTGRLADLSLMRFL